MEPTNHVKYIGLYFRLKSFVWNVHINQLSKKLSRSNGILSKPRRFIPQKTIISVYYAIFYSHLLYGCSVSSLATENMLNTITVLQKMCVRLMYFAPLNSHTNDWFVKNNILKFKDNPYGTN